MTALAIGCNDQSDRRTAKERLELIGLGLERRTIGIALGLGRLERVRQARDLRDIRSFAPHRSRPEPLRQACKRRRDATADDQRADQSDCKREQAAEYGGCDGIALASIDGACRETDRGAPAGCADAVPCEIDRIVPGPLDALYALCARRVGKPLEQLCRRGEGARVGSGRARNPASIAIKNSRET